MKKGEDDKIIEGLLGLTKLTHNSRGLYQPPKITAFADNKERISVLRARQNINHRDRLLKHIIWFEYIIFGILSLVLVCYVKYRFIYPNLPPLFSDVALNILVVGVFAEITGLVYIVAHYLWWRPKYSIKNK